MRSQHTGQYLQYLYNLQSTKILPPHPDLMISDEYNEFSENNVLYQQLCHTIPANGSSG